MSQPLPFKMKDDALYFVPLGGCGIFGANMSLYGYRGQWIMVDCGMGFADETMPGVDILLPDPAFAQSLGDKLLGIVFTHGHEDHVGAVEKLWPRIRKPLYATKFTSERLRQAVSETTWGNEVKVNLVPLGGKLTLGPFEISFIDVAHSIPEACALAIKAGDLDPVLHTGDWKIDPAPILGRVTDEKALRALGDKNVLAVMGDSTNAMVPGHSGSEQSVADGLTELFSEFKEGAIAISCFSTNVARLCSISEAAHKNGRKVCLIGRSLWNADEAARNSGYLLDTPPFLDDEEADLYAIEKLVYVCTGSQGEPRAALARIASDDHKALRLHDGDVMIFSSRAIPGNERAIDRVKNRLYAKGVNIITDRDAPIHVSGHPYRDELKAMYSWVRPKFAIPVHGEQMQMEKHAELARECGVSAAIVPNNGQVIEITPTAMKMLGEVKSGMLAIEGNRIVAIDHEAILTRKRMMWNGSAVVTVVVDAKGKLMADPKVTALGLLDENSEHDADFFHNVVLEIKHKIKTLSPAEKSDDEVLSEAVRITARRFFQDNFDRRPQTRVHLVRI